jgi:diacylglycerol kinase (ATP)
LVETRSFSDTIEQAQATKAETMEVVVAVGGDGTANAVANGLCRIPADSRPSMGVIPCGRGNDFATILGITNWETGCAALLEGRRRRVDVGRTDAGFFLGVAGAGFDSKVARRAQTPVPLLTGTTAYVYALFRTLTEFVPFPARITYDSGSYEGPITFAVAGNTDRYGGGMRITPQASIEDGLLDLCLVKDVSRLTLLRVFPRVFNGTHILHPKISYIKTKWLTIDSSEPAELFADGEFIQSLPARIDVLPSELEVVTKQPILKAR